MIPQAILCFIRNEAQGNLTLITDYPDMTNGRKALYQTVENNPTYRLHDGVPSGDILFVISNFIEKMR